MKTNEYIIELQGAIGHISSEDIRRFADRIIKVKGITYIIGNGGSNATASHFAEDLVKAAGIRAIAIDSVPLITAAANDNGYEASFGTGLATLTTENDLIVGISGSGNSKNVLLSHMHAPMIALLGNDGGEIVNYVQDTIIVRCNDIQIIEDVHMAICHMIVSKIIGGIRV